MEKSESIVKLAAALAKFQGEVPLIVFDDKVTVRTKTGGNYSFGYASMSKIKGECKPFLLKNGLSVVQFIGNNTLTTTILHESGEYLSDTMLLPIRDGMTCQEIGSVVTYMRRYSYSSALNIVSDEDDDGNIGAGNDVTKTPKKEEPTGEEPKKEELTPTHNRWNAARKHVKAGGSVDDVLKKYSINDANLKKLNA